MKAIELKQIRKNLQLTQKEMAESIGITVRGYQYYENGSRKIPKTTASFVQNMIKNEQNQDEQNQINESMVKYGPEIKESLHNFLEKIITDTIRKETERKFQMLNEKVMYLLGDKMNAMLEDKISKSEKKKKTN